MWAKLAFWGSIPGIAPISPAGPYLLLRSGLSCGPCLDKGPGTKQKSDILGARSFGSFSGDQEEAEGRPVI